MQPKNTFLCENENLAQKYQSKAVHSWAAFSFEHIKIIVSMCYNIFASLQALTFGVVIMSAVEFKDVVKIYDKGEGKQIAVDNVSFTIEKGEFAVIPGQSGAGISTVPNMPGGMDVPICIQPVRSCVTAEIFPKYTLRLRTATSAMLQ